MSELIQRLREYWCNQTTVARREWRNTIGAVALVESNTRYPSVVISIEGRLTIMPYPAWNRHEASQVAEAIARLAGAEEVSEPMERRSGT